MGLYLPGDAVRNPNVPEELTSVEPEHAIAERHEPVVHCLVYGYHGQGIEIQARKVREEL